MVHMIIMNDTTENEEIKITKCAFKAIAFERCAIVQTSQINEWCSTMSCSLNYNRKCSKTMPLHQQKIDANQRNIL